MRRLYAYTPAQSEKLIHSYFKSLVELLSYVNIDKFIIEVSACNDLEDYFTLETEISLLKPDTKVEVMWVICTLSREELTIRLMCDNCRSYTQYMRINEFESCLRGECLRGGR